MEKLTYALVISTRSLRAYFKSHTVVVYTNHPLKQIFHKLDQSRRMLRWSIKLCGCDIRFAPRIAIKAQTLSNFLAELSFTEAPPPEGLASSPVKESTWTMKVDGVVNSQGARFSITMKSPFEQYKEL